MVPGAMQSPGTHLFMSAKLIIYVTGKPLMHGYKMREFVWSAPHGCYLYEGAEIEAYEFNEKYAKAIKTNADLNPKVKVVGDAQFAMPLPIITTSYSEMTVEEAEAVMLRLAPERLKKKPGPKPALEVA